MKKQILSLFLLLLAPASLFAQTVEQDASIRQGKLKNGLTYYIRHNAKEAGLADFYIAQRVGSILVWLTSWSTWRLMVPNISLARVSNWASCLGARPSV